MPFSYTCDRCDKPFTRIQKIAHDNKYCSTECYHKSTVKSKEQACKQCGGLFTPTGTRKKDFCSWTCYLESKKAKTVTKLCPVCNKHFTVNKSTAYRYKVCSYECRTKNTIRAVCERCGEPFTGQQNKVRRYCSEECRRPPVMKICKNCNKEFRVEPKGNRTFCSFSCYRSHTGESSIETIVRNCLDFMNLPYAQELQVKNYCIDFAFESLMFGIECDGTFWHRDKDRELKRDITLLNRGWTILHLTEDEINKSENLGSLILSRSALLGITFDNAKQPPKQLSLII